MAHINFRRSRTFSLLGLFALALFAVAFTTVLSLIPLYVPRNDFNINNNNNIDNITVMQALTAAKNSLTSLTVSYMLPSGFAKKRSAQLFTNRQATAENLRQATGSPSGSILVDAISSARATGTKGRRRRDIQCDKTDRPGIAIVFDVALAYPENLPCQNLSCQVSLFTGIHQQFNTATNVAITADDGSTLPVQLCHVESNPNGHSNNVNNSSSGGIVVEPCSIICQNGGGCTGPTTCACTTGWSGDTCTIGNKQPQQPQLQQLLPSQQPQVQQPRQLQQQLQQLLPPQQQQPRQVQQLLPPQLQQQLQQLLPPQQQQPRQVQQQLLPPPQQPQVQQQLQVQQPRQVQQQPQQQLRLQQPRQVQQQPQQLLRLQQLRQVQQQLQLQLRQQQQQQVTTKTTTTTTTPVPTCSPSVCCSASSCTACVVSGTTYYCTWYGSGGTGYNFYSSASSCAASGSASNYCTYSPTCGSGAGSPGVGSGAGC
ncbi:unnamed protein product [Adineta steineri]|uniref:EGF-like domain-containing protein n=1 Tax=Adineta steineri TaxID=433720 RepID=A0A814RLW4_9BILA|nr:unnamed protein product [Adineta steineri]